MAKPLILVVNDDGIYSPGLHAAAEAATQLGDIIIAAPHEQQTAMGRARPRSAPRGIVNRVTVPVNGGDHDAFSVVASPAMTVAHVVLELAPRKPDLVISGINYGENVAFSLSSSGTVGAALEAASFGIPALAMSLETDIHHAHATDYERMEWAAAQHFTRVFAAQLLARGLPPHVALLNVNVPADATPQTPVRVTRLSSTNYYTFYDEQPERDLDQPFRPREYKLADRDVIEPDSDVWAVVHDRVVSVTPLIRNQSADAGFLAAWGLPGGA